MCAFCRLEICTPSYRTLHALQEIDNSFDNRVHNDDHIQTKVCLTRDGSIVSSLCILARSKCRIGRSAIDCAQWREYYLLLFARINRKIRTEFAGVQSRSGVRACVFNARSCEWLVLQTVTYAGAQAAETSRSTRLGLLLAWVKNLGVTLLSKTGLAQYWPTKKILFCDEYWDYSSPSDFQLRLVPCLR